MLVLVARRSEYIATYSDRRESQSAFTKCKVYLGLSSPSVAHYHIRKLVEDGFVREGPGGYVVDRVLFENMLRVRNSIIPFQTTFLTIFLSSLILTLTVFRAPVVSGEYLFALSMNLVAVGIFLWETFRTIRPKRI